MLYDLTIVLHVTCFLCCCVCKTGERLAQIKSYGKLVLAVKAAMGDGGIVSVALHPGQLLPPKATRVVDRVHLMAYDAPDQHSTMHFAQLAVNYTLKHGVPAHKLVLGVPAYGRHPQNREHVKTYAEIMDGETTLALEPETDTSKEGLYFNGRRTAGAKAAWAHKQG